MARVRHECRNWWRVLSSVLRVLTSGPGGRQEARLERTLLLFSLGLLASCGNPSPNSNNINFPYGIAVCSYTCNAVPGSTKPISPPFAAVTSYGSRQILLFSAGNATNPYGFQISHNSQSPTAKLFDALQGPDGLLISSQGFKFCAAPVLYGADWIGNKIGIWCGFNPADTSNPSPTITISSSAFQSPEGMALDWVNESGGTLSAPILFVANPGSSDILAFDLNQLTGPGSVTLSPSGDLLPGTNGGLPFGQPANNTSLNGPAFVAFSNSKNTLFVSNTGNSQVNIYGNGYCIGVNLESGTGCPETSQNIPPTNWISGTNTFLSSPVGLAWYQGALYVADFAANGVMIWDNLLGGSTSGGNLAPTRRINGSNTGFNAIYALAIDTNPNAPPGNIFYLTQINNGNLLGYNNATTVSGNIAPTFTVNVVNPTLSSGNGTGGGSTGYPGFP